jgi:hypothetical protein
MGLFLVLAQSFLGMASLYCRSPKILLMVAYKKQPALFH